MVKEHHHSFPEQTPYGTGVSKQVLFAEMCSTPQSTQTLAQQLVEHIGPGEVVGFIGELGTGKTFMIQAICRALGTVEHPTSPTFTLLQEYHTSSGLVVYHFDFYRINDLVELQELGVDEFFYGKGICLVEWADKIRLLLPVPRLEVHLAFVPGRPTARRIDIYRVQGACK